jgi:hypothetical protein
MELVDQENQEFAAVKNDHETEIESLIEQLEELRAQDEHEEKSVRLLEEKFSSQVQKC